MRTLKFEVNGQILTKNKTCDFSGLTRGTTGYLNALFLFDSNWKNMVKVAEFRPFGKTKVTSASLKDGICDIPNEIANEKMWKVRIIGKDKEKRLITNEITIRQEG